MRKIVLLAITLIIFVSFSHAADVPCANLTIDGKVECIACSGKNSEGAAIAGVEGGVANCGACTITAEKVLTCTSCLNNHFFASSAKAKCSQCKAGCNGGNCADVTSAEEVESTPCTSCVGAHFLSEGLCTACTEGCKSCSSAATCSACVKDAEFLVRPETGACVAACASPKGQGVLASGAKVCSEYAAPNVAPVAAFNTSNNTLSIASLCSPSSTEEANKKLEKVGAVVILTLDAAPTDIDVLAIRNVIQTQTKTSDADFAAKNTVYKNSRTTWINIVGTDAGTAALSEMLPKGMATINWVCVNTFNVKSALTSVKVNFNGTLNPSVKFSVSLNRTLNDAELNNLTCAVAGAIFADNASYPLLKNNKNLSCTAAAKRVLQAAAAPAYGDYSFEVAADQNNDGLAASVKGKLDAVKTAVSNYAKTINATVVSDAAVMETPAGANLNAPVLGVSATPSVDNITVVVNTTAAANVYWALVYTKDNIAAADDDLLRGTSARALRRGKFEVGANSNKTSVIDKLNASTSFDIWVSAANWYDASVKTAAKKYTVSTGSSFSSLLTLGSMILLVLALFI
jgi:hypothetical protein